jgi:magnesium transporter
VQKALNIFNAALVTPTYYVFFTSATIVTSAILFQGFKGTPIGIATVIMGFLQICAGVVLLQLSKSAKDVPDAAVFKGDLDQVREVAEQEQPETEPKADAIRGTAAIIRRFSVSRQKMEQEEARRLREDKLKDQLEPLRENEVVEWDGLRRRKTIIGSAEFGGPVRRKTIHPPLGMSRFPDQTENEEAQRQVHESHGFLEGLRNRAQSVLSPQQRNATSGFGDPRSPIHPMPLTEINVQSGKPDTPIVPYGPGSFEEAQEHIYGFPPALQEGRNIKGTHSPRSKPLPNSPRDQSPALRSRNKDSLAPDRPEHSTRRQFSFTNVFHRTSKTPDRPTSSEPNLASSAAYRSTSRAGLASRSGSSTSHEQKKAMKSATEEERLGLVKGDSHAALLQKEHSPPRPSHSQSSSSASESFVPYDLKSYVHGSNPLSEDEEDDEDGDWQVMNRRTDRPPQSPPRRLPQYEQSQLAIQQPPPRPPRAALNPSQTSNLNLQTNFPPTLHHAPEYTLATEEAAASEDPKDYEANKSRFRQQRARDRGQRNDRGDGSAGIGAGGAFV